MVPVSPPPMNRSAGSRTSSSSARGSSHVAGVHSAGVHGVRVHGGGNAQIEDAAAEYPPQLHDVSDGEGEASEDSMHSVSTLGFPIPVNTDTDPYWRGLEVERDLRCYHNMRLDKRVCNAGKDYGRRFLCCGDLHNKCECIVWVDAPWPKYLQRKLKDLWMGGQREMLEKANILQQLNTAMAEIQELRHKLGEMQPSWLPTTELPTTDCFVAGSGCTFRASSKRKAILGLGRPKRAPTPFFTFLPKYKEEHPDVKGVVAVTKAPYQKWRSMSDEEKAEYGGSKKRDATPSKPANKKVSKLTRSQSSRRVCSSLIKE